MVILLTIEIFKKLPVKLSPKIPPLLTLLKKLPKSSKI